MLEIVKIIARDAFTAGDFSTALAAAREALPYTAPRLTAVAGPDPNKATLDEIANSPDPKVMDFDRFN